MSNIATAARQPAPTGGQTPPGAADRYLALGYSVIPVGRDKRPLLPSWKDYQTRRPTPEEIAEWRRRYPSANVGIVTGRVSGLAVVDLDGPEGEEAVKGLHLPLTPTATTGKGAHYYYAHPGSAVPNAVRLLPGVDLRADGGYVVAPPSLHPSGRRYVWVEGCSPWDLPLARLPEWVLERLTAPGAPQGHAPEWWRELVAHGVPEGRRNDAVARLAGHLLRRHVDPYVTLDLVRAWNQARCRPPLPDDEVVRTVDSVAGRELRRRGAHP